MSEQKKYKIVGNLPGGGQGNVHLVNKLGDTEKKLYVVKTLKNINRIGRLENEVRACLNLDDPNILKVVDHDFGKDNEFNKPYIITEYCKGGDLQNYKWRENDTLSILRRFSEICQGVAYAHSQGVIHRDLKPANIFVREDESLVVGDFGLCYLSNETEEADRQTSEYEVVGSRWFTAPELSNGRLDNVTTQCDVYSLGKILHWMFFRKPFDREDHRDDQFNIRMVDGKLDPRRFDLEFVNQLLDHLIAKDPAKRLKNAGEVFQAVRSVMRLIEMNAHPLGNKAPQHCSYCGRGVYQPAIDPFQNLRPEDRGSQLTYWGLPTGLNWMLLQCTHCGHLQYFGMHSTALKAWKGTF